jgi:hypothetical protein
LIRLCATKVCASTTATLQNELVDTTEIRISTQTTPNRLHEREFNPRRSANVPHLNPEQRRAKRLFAQEHVDWNLEQGSNDESKFCLHHNDGRVRVWRRPRERYLAGTLEEKIPFGGGSIMVWGGIILNGRMELVVIREEYIDDVLEPHV